jgi:hypothetical protein
VPNEAHARVLQRAAEMQRDATALAHDLANRYLARYGFTAQTWVAAVGTNPSGEVLVQAGAIERDVRRAAEGLRAKAKQTR